MFSGYLPLIIYLGYTKSNTTNFAENAHLPTSQHTANMSVAQNPLSSDLIWAVTRMFVPEFPGAAQAENSGG